jgi:hemerythrin-like domain-containing protein
MRCTDALMADHEVILRALHVLDTMTAEIKRGNDVSRPDINSLLVFLREFADGSHHVKEEAVFVPALMQAGMGLQEGPLQAMASEHERGRALNIAMRDAMERDHKEDFVRYADRYARLLTEHIEKEDYVLFDKAEQILTDEDDEKVLEAFAQFDDTILGGESHVRLLRWLDTLGSKYGDGRTVLHGAADER